MIEDTQKIELNINQENYEYNFPDVCYLYGGECNLVINNFFFSWKEERVFSVRASSFNVVGIQNLKSNYLIIVEII